MKVNYQPFKCLPTSITRSCGGDSGGRHPRYGHRQQGGTGIRARLQGNGGNRIESLIFSTALI